MVGSKRCSGRSQGLRQRDQRVELGARRAAGNRLARKRHSGGDTAKETSGDKRLGAGGPGRKQGSGDGEDHAQYEHGLSPIAVTDGTEIEDRSGETKGEANADEVERSLGGLEVQTDIGQCDIGDGEVQIGHCGHRHEGSKDETCSCGGVRWGGISGDGFHRSMFACLAASRESDRSASFEEALKSDIRVLSEDGSGQFQ